MLDGDGGGGARDGRGVARKKMKTRGQGKSEKEDPLSLFIRRWINGMRGNRGGRKTGLCGYTDASIFGRSIKDKDLLRYSGLHAKLMQDDVMAG
jgi:hypothetical protein